MIFTIYVGAKCVCVLSGCFNFAWETVCVFFVFWGKCWDREGGWFWKRDAFLLVKYAKF